MYDDHILLQRSYVSLGFTQEAVEWPYTSISRCVIVPDQFLDKSFSVMLLTVDSSLKIVGIPQKIALKKLARHIESLGVSVERGRSVPARFKKGLDKRIFGAAAVAGAILFGSGLAIYAHRVGGADGKVADARPNVERPQFDRVAPLPGAGNTVPNSATPGPSTRPKPGASTVSKSGKPAQSTPNKSNDTALVGDSVGGGVFRMTSPKGEPLVGFRYSLGSWAGTPAIQILKPLFSRDVSSGFGKAIVARAGYVVGALKVDAPKYVSAIQIVFMRVTPDGRLDPSDSYTSDWIGDPTGKPAKTLTGAGAKVIGIHGRQGAIINAVGLVLEPS
jgi:hypothetical protein